MPFAIPSEPMFLPLKSKQRGEIAGEETVSINRKRTNIRNLIMADIRSMGPGCAVSGEIVINQ